ncbi:MAG: hypothetical protein ABEJ36_00415 [Candidatus Nanosalina sp.]
MTFRSGLKEKVTAESPAYGYTLSIWGSGALLITQFTVQGAAILAFILGGVIGFGVLSDLAFGSLMRKFQSEQGNEMLVISMIHILASFGAVTVNFFLARNLAALNSELIAFIMGFVATTGYNVLLLVEHYLYEDLYEIEAQQQQ